MYVTILARNAMRETITSTSNIQVKYWQKLKKKKFRDSELKCLVFGRDMIDMLVPLQLIDTLITTNPSHQGTLVTKQVMALITDTETLYEDVAVVRMPMHQIDTSRYLILSDIQDPTNVGALLRSALAFGFHQVLMSEQTADVYHERAIRAAKGATFFLSFQRGALNEWMLKLKQQGVKLIYADAHEGKLLSPIQGQKVALVLGNEGHGLNEHIKALCDEGVHIQTTKVESLNVAVAGAIIMHGWQP
jgi:RNA methyltransferase, TrmH family